MANCHALGLFSIPIEIDDRYVRRMFIDTFGNTHTVAPHSHRYNLKLDMVSGYMNHSIWTQRANGAVAMFPFRWESPMNDSKTFSGEPIFKGRFERQSDYPDRYNVDSQEMRPGQSLMMQSEEIHSLVTRPGTSWIITEYLDETEDTVTLHHNPTYEPNLDGLYVPIGEPMKLDLPF